MDKHRTKFPGVRYVEHPTRKHGVQRDKYFYIRYQVDGRRREEGLGWLTEKMTAEKAAGVLAELKEAKRRGSNEPTTLKARRQKVKAEAEHRKKEGLTFGQFFRDTYFPIAKVSKKPESWKKEEEHFRLYLEPVLGNKPLKDIKPLTVERIKKNILDAVRSPRFLQYVFATLRQVWNMARRDGLVSDESPTKAVKTPKIENKRVRFLSQEEAADLLAYLKLRHRTIHDMAFLSLFTGMRFGEVKSLKWGAVDLDRSLITIFDAKGGSRMGFMTPEVRAMFIDREKGKPEDLVFTTFDGREYTDTPTTFRDAVKALGFNQGITDQRQKVLFHSLRHSYASWLVEAGTDLYSVKELLGHGTITMTERYSHLSPDSLQNAVKRLPKLNEGKATKGKVIRLDKQPSPRL